MTRCTTSANCITLGFAWYLQKVSGRESAATFTYGYRRFSVLGALITGVVLLVGLLFIVWTAAARLLHPEPVYAPGMIVIAVMGIVFTGAAVLRFESGDLSRGTRIFAIHQAPLPDRMTP